MRKCLLIVCAVLCCATPAWAGESDTEEEYPAYEPGERFNSDERIYSLTALDLLEVAPLSEQIPGTFDGFWRLGNTYDSFWLKAEAEGQLREPEGEAELQALYSRIITEFFDVQAGVRVDAAFDDELRARPLLVVGMEGLVPFLFEIEPAVFVSLRGDVSARLEASYDLYITQRLILEPEVELNAAVQPVEDWGVGSGLNDIELGSRLRYEIIPEIAPYIGVNWTRLFAETADFARADGEVISELRFVAGASLWW